ncbi:MAG TPA: hypothetical protein VNC11_02215 [Gemmatimonadaceae bacterium]|nr:hypothetical protein [Gemmatimonadaceae bacterium]
MSESSKGKVREPVQVYLTQQDRRLLKEVAAAAGVSGAEVLRRGLRRMAGEVLSDRSPAMQMLEEMNSAKWSPDAPRDMALNHDKYLADAYLPQKTKRRRK